MRNTTEPEEIVQKGPNTKELKMDHMKKNVPMLWI